MTKLSAALIVAAVLFGVWELWVWYDNVEHEKEEDKNKAKVGEVVGDALPGMPGEFEAGYQDIKNKGAEPLKKWLAV